MEQFADRLADLLILTLLLRSSGHKTPGDAYDAALARGWIAPIEGAGEADDEVFHVTDTGHAVAAEFRT